MRARPPALLPLLLWLVATAGASECPEDEQRQHAVFGSGRHLVAYVVLSTCDLLDRAVKPTPAEVRRYLDAAAGSAGGQFDWHANYSCPEDSDDGQGAAYPAEVERQLASSRPQDTLFDLPVDVASSAADCFSEVDGDSGDDACAPCADFLNLRARLRDALGGKARALASALRNAAAPRHCSQGEGDAVCREWQRQRTPVGLLEVPVAEAAEAALRLWGRLCTSAGGCCGRAGHALTVRDELWRFQASLDNARTTALERAVDDALGAARQVAGRSQLGAAASAALEEARRDLEAALADQRAVLHTVRSAQREALGAALLGAGCAGGALEAAEAAEAAAWGLARHSVGRVAARLLGEESGRVEGRWGGAAPGFQLTAQRGLRALQLVLCQAQRVSRATAALSASVVVMLAHSAAPPPTDDHIADAQAVATASHFRTIRVALPLSVAAVLPALFVL
ncbi:uncharacterized protein LOC126190827 [Schistocerca cancellata]|uniref:uncharacterized protein LOC126190827 n=1 Tax=Schistocerca cancellata TaxID=274614 RepID=UPI00211996C9|nr:uncharacterized protein LOC126190827 [Schistocerca cancellata]